MAMTVQGQRGSSARDTSCRNAIRHWSNSLRYIWKPAEPLLSTWQMLTHTQFCKTNILTEIWKYKMGRMHMTAPPSRWRVRIWRPAVFRRKLYDNIPISFVSSAFSPTKVLATVNLWQLWSILCSSTYLSRTLSFKGGSMGWLAFLPMDSNPGRIKLKTAQIMPSWEIHWQMISLVQKPAQTTMYLFALQWLKLNPVKRSIPEGCMADVINYTNR